MKSLLYNFLTAIMILIVSVLTGCQSTENKVDQAQENVEEAKEELQEVKQEAVAEAIQVANAEEWSAFKTDAELKIKNNQIRIADLKVKMKKSGKNLDEMYAKNIEALDQKNKDLTASIETYENNQSDWESFKREFNHDMDELGKALKDMTVNNKD